MKRSNVFVIFLIAFLALQIVIPWLNAGREMARNRACKANLRRVAMGLCEFHEAKGILPPAAVWSGEQLDPGSDLISDRHQLRFLREKRPVSMIRKSWIHFIIPNIGLSNDQFDHSRPIVDESNGESRIVQHAELMCPSDDLNSEPFVIMVDESKVSFARGNYAVNGGTQNIYEAPGWLSNPRATGVLFESNPSIKSFALWGNGVAGINKQFSFDDFDNGLGKTVLVNEIRAGVSKIDPRGVWALGQIGSNITWGHGVNGDAYGPNNQVKDADDIRGCIEMHQTLGPEFLSKQKMPCCDHCVESNQAGSRSQHPGGVNLVMADGSARFVTDQIDVGLWHVMHSRLTPKGVLDESFERELALNGHWKSKAPEKSLASSRKTGRGATLQNSIGQKFRLIPDGEFVMGLANKGNSAPYPVEAPAHKVTISSPYYFGVHEVTRAQFAKIMGKDPSVYNSVDEEPHELAEYPVENVTWYEADEFCRKLSKLPEEVEAGRSYRLPTEAEWERAARGGNDAPIPFESTWTNDDGSGVIGGKNWKDTIPLRPVGCYPPNEYGIHDICGNVFEWTNDWFRLDYYRKSPKVDPQGPESGYLRVVRGWYWVFTGPACVANPTTPPWIRCPYIGFRVVCELE